MSVYFVTNTGDRIEFPDKLSRSQWAANNGITLSDLSESDRDRLIELNSGPTYNVLGFRPLNGIEGMRRPTFTTHSTVPNLPLNSFGMRGRGINAYNGTLGSDRFNKVFYNTSDYDALLGDIRRELIAKNYGTTNPFRQGADAVGNAAIDLSLLAVGTPALSRAKNLTNFLFGTGVLGTGIYGYNLLNTGNTSMNEEKPDSVTVTAGDVPLDTLSSPVPERDPDENDNNSDKNQDDSNSTKNSLNKPKEPKKTSPNSKEPRSFVPFKGYKSHPIWSTFRDLNYADIIGAVSADVKQANETGEPFLPKATANATLPGLVLKTLIGIPGFMLKMAYGDSEKQKNITDSVPPTFTQEQVDSAKAVAVNEAKKAEELKKVNRDVDTTGMVNNQLLINL